MKKIKFIYFILALFLFSACEDEEAIRIPEFGTGPNVRFQWNPQFGFLNLEDLENTFVRYSLFSESTDLEVVELQAIRNTTDTVVIRSYTQSDFNSNNGVFENEDISARDLADAYGITLADFAGGDSFEFRNVTTMANGTVYPSPTIQGNTNVGPSITGGSATQSFTSSYTAYVGCPSDAAAFEGEYIAEVIAGFSVGATNEVTITFEGPEPFRYGITDISAEIYVPFGGEQYPGDFYDICGTPLPLTTRTFGTTIDNGGSSWDPETGILILDYFETFNGIGWTIRFTPVEE